MALLRWMPQLCLARCLDVERLFGLFRLDPVRLKLPRSYLKL